MEVTDEERVKPELPVDTSLPTETSSPSRPGDLEKEDSVPVYDDKENYKDEDDEEPPEDDVSRSDDPSTRKKVKNRKSSPASEINIEDEMLRIQVEESKATDPVVIAQLALIEKVIPSTELEIAYKAVLERKEVHLNRLSTEIMKLKQFISKRKQTYKRKRKDDGAPTRALSAYNIFIQDRFARLAKENETALMSEDVDATMKRVPPASLVAATGNAWKALPAEEKLKYEERAKSDRKRYEDQMAEYHPPDKIANRKRNKTGYNMFFSAHVVRLKQTESGVPSERGSVARLVGSAWKALNQEEKAFYEREADKHNGMNPIREGDEEDDGEEIKRQQMEYHMHAAAAAAHHEMHNGLPPPGMHGGVHHHVDTRQPPPPPHHHGYYPPHMYAPPPPPYGHYDYSQHQRHHQARAQGYQQAYPPPPPRHAYEG